MSMAGRRQDIELDGYSVRYSWRIINSAGGEPGVGKSTLALSWLCIEGKTFSMFQEKKARNR